jgi:hypothetical protein
VEIDEQAWWQPDVGLWHADCEEPRNLKTYIREAALRKRERF